MQIEEIAQSKVKFEIEEYYATIFLSAILLKKAVDNNLSFDMIIECEKGGDFEIPPLLASEKSKKEITAFAQKLFNKCAMITSEIKPE